MNIQKSSHVISQMILAVGAVAGLAFAGVAAYIHPAFAQESISGEGFGTIIFQDFECTELPDCREFFADIFFRAEATVNDDGESTLIGRFAACNPFGIQCTIGDITEGEIAGDSYRLKGTDLQNTSEGEPLGPACEEGTPGCNFVLFGRCGEDVTMRFVAAGNIRAVAQGDVLCVNE